MPKKFPKDIQKLILEYADYKPGDKFKEFYRNGNNHALENTQLTVIGPAIVLATKIYSYNSLPRQITAGVTFFLTAVVMAPFAPLVGAGTALKDLSMFTKRKYKEKGAKEIFDADLLDRPFKRLKS